MHDVEDKNLDEVSVNGLPTCQAAQRGELRTQERIHRFLVTSESATEVDLLPSSSGRCRSRCRTIYIFWSMRNVFAGLL